MESTKAIRERLSRMVHGLGGPGSAYHSVISHLEDEDAVFEFLDKCKDTGMVGEAAYLAWLKCDKDGKRMYNDIMSITIKTVSDVPIENHDDRIDES